MTGDRHLQELQAEMQNINVALKLFLDDNATHDFEIDHESTLVAHSDIETSCCFSKSV